MKLQSTTYSLESALRSVVEGFQDSLHELRSVALLRVEDTAVEIFEGDMAALLNRVRTMEDQFREVKEAVAQEKQALRKAEEVTERCTTQTLHLNFINAHLPLHLPQQPIPSTAASTLNLESTRVDKSSAEAISEAVQAPEHQGHDKKKKLLQAPRRYVSETEYSALSTYMTQRLPLSKVNTAVEEAADLAESNMRMLAHAKSGGKMATSEWKRAQSLLVNISVQFLLTRKGKDAVKSKCWLTDVDLRKSSVLKPDKTGKAIMTILRHLGRIHEARLTLDGKLESIYVLIPDTH